MRTSVASTSLSTDASKRQRSTSQKTFVFWLVAAADKSQQQAFCPFPKIPSRKSKHRKVVGDEVNETPVWHSPLHTSARHNGSREGELRPMTGSRYANVKTSDHT